MSYISNKDFLSVNDLRKDAISIVEEAYNQIDTSYVIQKECFIENGFLFIKNEKFNLSSYEHIYLIGFGKASCLAVSSLEKVLDKKVSDGVVIDKSPGVCQVVQVYKGEHPVPTHHNVEISKKIADLAIQATEKDLVIVVVSGGGSSLLCFPMSECDQGANLYDIFLKTGGNIQELNTIRKHISEIKGGGLAKLLYPATVASLIFSDVPGDAYDQVASGPTYKDKTTVDDALKILEKYNISEHFDFVETPKEDIYFEKVKNIPIISNVIAVDGMKRKAEELGYNVVILSTSEYREASFVIDDMKKKLAPKTVVIVAGEPSVVVNKKGDKGGRSLYAGLKALSVIEDNEIFIPFATDGIDNMSDAAGVLIDKLVLEEAKKKNIDISFYEKEAKLDELFTLLQNKIITGPTGSNVSDCIIYIKG